MEYVFSEKKLLTAEGQYEVALKVACPFCKALSGTRCSGIVLPQYPHNARLEAALYIPIGAWEHSKFDESGVPLVSYFLNNGLPVFSITDTKTQLFWWGVNSRVVGLTEDAVKRAVFDQYPHSVFQYKEDRDRFWAGWVDGVWYAREFAEGRQAIPKVS